jgi:hypothetical protein
MSSFIPGVQFSYERILNAVTAGGSPDAVLQLPQTRDSLILEFYGANPAAAANLFLAFRVGGVLQTGKIRFASGNANQANVAYLSQGSGAGLVDRVDIAAGAALDSTSFYYGQVFLPNYRANQIKLCRYSGAVNVGTATIQSVNGACFLNDNGAISDVVVTTNAGANLNALRYSVYGVNWTS